MSALALVVSILMIPQGWLGLRAEPARDVESRAGRVVVLSVVPEGPAALAGIREGDRILSFGGKTVADFDSLARAVRETKPGARVLVAVIREGKLLTLPVDLSERPAEGKGPSWVVTTTPPATPSRTAKVKRGYLGVDVLALTSGLEGYFGAEEGGLLVTEVKPDSPAERGGVRAGDIISGVNGEKVDEPFELQTAIRSLRKGEAAALDIVREGKRIARNVEVGEREAEAFYLSLEGLPRPSLMYRYDPGQVEAQRKALQAYLEALRQEISDPRRRQELLEMLRQKELSFQHPNLDDERRKLEAKMRETEKQLQQIEKQLQELDRKQSEMEEQDHGEPSPR